MNWIAVLFFGIIINATFPILRCNGEEIDLAKKVVRMGLNQNEPAQVKIGLQGITTLEFPAKIEAIDGYGFSQQPDAERDLFQLSYNKGTNFFSLKALKAGAQANLTVVINQKVYALFCEEDGDPSFVVIFGAPGPQPAGAEKKIASAARLLGFLDKVKGYPTLKTAAPDAVSALSVAEPNKKAAADGIETVLTRVIRDDSLDSVGFEVQLNNRTQKDFYFDPEGFGVRIGDEVYQQSVSDAGGIVPASTSVPAFFVVTGTASGGRNDLAVNNNFDLVIRAVDAEKKPKGTTEFTQPPADYLPTAANLKKQSAEPPLSQDGDGNKAKKGPREVEKGGATPSPQAESKSTGKKTARRVSNG
jgi:hypothetical protein